jgi:hypothetical protein
MLVSFLRKKNYRLESYLFAPFSYPSDFAGSYTSFGGVAHENKVRQRFKIPDTHIIVASLATGKSSQFVCEIPRDPSENKFTSNYYGNS